MEFENAYALLFAHERGYVNNPNDPGGETKFGVSKRSYPHVDIKNLTHRQAKYIMKRDFWMKVRAAELPAWVRFDVFDGAVNSGPAQSIRWLQLAVGVSDDGVLGPISMAAISEANALRTLMIYNAVRLSFMTRRSNWPDAGRGWAARISTNIVRGARSGD